MNKLTYFTVTLLIIIWAIGFSPEYSDRIFELFSRLHNKDEIAGTGIGLAICKKIVDNHKGFIFAEGKPHKGATFTVYLPEV